MADYKQRLIGEWRAQGQSGFELPTHAYAHSTWSQTTSQWTTLVPALPNPVPQTITMVNAPVTQTSVSGFGLLQNSRIVGLPVYGNTLTRTFADVTVAQQISNSAVISVQLDGGSYAEPALSYSFFAGGGGPFSNSRTYQTNSGFVTNTIVESSAEGWVPLTLREDGIGSFSLNIQDVWSELAIEDITAGPGNNTIYGATDNRSDTVALIDAGAGNDIVHAGQYDFVFGNDGDDEIDGGAYAYGGNGYDWLSNGQFMAGGADDDYLIGGEGATTFYFRSDEAGWDYVEDQNGISLNEFALRAGFSETLSSLAYGGKYRLGGETSFQFQMALEEQLEGRSNYYDFLNSISTYAEIEVGEGEFRRYRIPGESADFPRGVPDPFFRGPYVGDGFDTWVYNSVADIARDLAAMGLPYDPADIQQIPETPDLSEFTADNHWALQPWFDSGLLEKDRLILDQISGAADELLVGFAPPEYEYDGRRMLRMVWGEDKVIDVELPSATDLIGHGIEEAYFGDEYFYIGDLVDYAQERGYLGTPFDDYIEGTDGDDRISGLGGWDWIDGGAGNDWLSGGAGVDEFYFEAGSGMDRILDPDAEDLIVFGSDVTPDQIQLGLGSLRLGYGNGDDAIHFEGFDPNDVYGGAMFAALQFYDTDTWTLLDELTYAQVLSLGFDITGTDGDDTLNGTNIHDRFHGGAGNDTLAGGAGSDTYYFRAGDGVDTIVDASATGDLNRVVLFDYLASDISGFRSGEHVILQAHGTSDEIRLLWNEDDGTGVDVVEFANGASWSRSDLDRLPVIAGNAAPVLLNAIGAVLATEDTAFNFTVPETTFSDPDAGDVLSYAVSAADGSTIPSWLVFEAGTRTFAGTPGNDDVGAIDLKSNGHRSRWSYGQRYVYA